MKHLANAVSYHTCSNWAKNMCTCLGIIKLTRDADGNVIGWHHVKKDKD